jgi:hypothetical protein
VTERRRRLATFSHSTKAETETMMIEVETGHVLRLHHSHNATPPGDFSNVPFIWTKFYPALSMPTYPQS